MICSVCKKAIKVKQGSLGTGFAINDNDEKICYKCCAKQDKKDLLNLKKGKTFYLYLSENHVVNWPSTLKIPISYKKESTNNFGAERIDVWFQIKFRNKVYKFWGVKLGDNEILRIKKVK